MAHAYIALGGNIEPERRLPQAARLLRARFPGIEFSPAYRNAAEGFDGEDFLNAAAGFDTDLAMPALVRVLHEVEEQCGRRRDDPKWAPRAMDLDLLLYDELIGEWPEATLPRRDLLRRAYMLGPMADIAPSLLHPVEHRSLRELWQELEPRSAPLTRIALDLARG